MELWIARDRNERLYTYSNKPTKRHHDWEGVNASLIRDIKGEFEEIKWEDEEPTKVSLVKVDDKLYVFPEGLPDISPFLSMLGFTNLDTNPFEQVFRGLAKDLSKKIDKEVKEKENKKYEMIKEGNLYRIKALKDFGSIKKGYLGGLIEKESNLSQEGNCWVYKRAKVSSNAKVSGNAEVYHSAEVSGNAQIYGNAKVLENAIVAGNAKVLENARVGRNLVVYGDAKITTNARELAPYTAGILITE